MAPDRGSAKNTLRINNQTLGAFRGGSLPNVSAGATTVKTATKTNKSTKVMIDHSSSPPFLFIMILTNNLFNPFLFILILHYYYYWFTF